MGRYKVSCSKFTGPYYRIVFDIEFIIADAVVILCKHDFVKTMLDICYDINKYSVSIY